MLRIAPAADQAGQVWAFLATKAAIEPRLARRVWAALCTRPESLPLRYAFTKALGAGPASSPPRRRMAAALVQGEGRPQAVIEAIERLVQVRALSRHDATLVQDKLLALVTSAGTWT